MEASFQTLWKGSIKLSTDSPTPKEGKDSGQVASSNCLYDLVCHFLPGLHREKMSTQTRKSRGHFAPFHEKLTKQFTNQIHFCFGKPTRSRGKSPVIEAGGMWHILDLKRTSKTKLIKID